MKQLCELSTSFCSMFALWSILLCCTGIIGIVLSLTVRQYMHTVVSLIYFGVSYFLWQICIYLKRFGAAKQEAEFIFIHSSAPGILYVIVLVILTGIAVWYLFSTIRYAETYITPLTIKSCADRMNCGICYWRKNGRVVFGNRSMNKLCVSLTGHPLMNGNIFRNAVTADVIPIMGKVWKFESRTLIFGGEPLFEMIAQDVTEIHEATEKLKRDNEQLYSMKEELCAYSLRIDDIVREQEILQAKINIHDEMNRLILSTMAADPEDADGMNRIFSLWEKNALLLCMEADEKRKDQETDSIQHLAEAMELQLVWNNKIPEFLTERQKKLFFQTAREAVTNAH